MSSFVQALEPAVINYLSAHHILAQRQKKVPGVYIEGRKISALGLRIRRGYSYHGFSLNANMDLSPFQQIHLCGYVGLEVIQLRVPL